MRMTPRWPRSVDNENRDDGQEDASVVKYKTAGNGGPVVKPPASLHPVVFALAHSNVLQRLSPYLHLLVSTPLPHRIRRLPPMATSVTAVWRLWPAPRTAASTWLAGQRTTNYQPPSSRTLSNSTSNVNSICPSYQSIWIIALTGALCILQINSRYSRQTFPSSIWSWAANCK